MRSQVLYVVPITSTLGRLALVPVGDTGTILFTMRKESKDFDGTSCNTKMGAGEHSHSICDELEQLGNTLDNIGIT